MGDLDRAIADYIEALRLDPESYVAYSNRGAAYTSKGNYAHALTDLSDAIRLNPNRVVAYNHRATVYMMKRDYVHAVADLSEQVRLEPDRAVHYNNRGLAYSFQGDLDRGIADFDHCLRLAPDFVAAYANRGSLDVKKGDFVRALSDFNEAIRRAPEDGNAYCDRGEMYMEQGRFDKGNMDLAKAVELNPEWASIYYKQALALLASGQVDRYQASCARMLERFAGSQDAEHQYWTAWTCTLAPHAVDDLPAAVALADKVLRTDPKSTRNLVTIGALLYRAERIEEAIARLTEADRLAQVADPSPESSPIYTWYFLAMAHAAAGHGDQAKEWLAKAVASTDKTLSDAQQVTWKRRLTLNLFRAEAEALRSEGS
jgi:tetratricopeptide (TPR) repeat protein